MLQAARVDSCETWNSDENGNIFHQLKEEISKSLFQPTRHKEGWNSDLDNVDYESDVGLAM